MAIAIVDLEAVTEPWWSPPADDPHRFAPAPAWRIVCACVLVVEEGKAPDMRTFAGDEREILIELRDVLSAATQIVTKGGRRYDLPVIMCRSLALGIEQGWYFAGRDGAKQDPRYRYAVRAKDAEGRWDSIALGSLMPEEQAEHVKRWIAEGRGAP